MTSPRITIPKRIDLRSYPGFAEATLEDEICRDPSILGLGALSVVERQRRQERAGVLDLLLENEDQTRRFEVELMLGKTNESHIIRCIEYWDIERRRYPGYEHVAVLVAEDITSRFLNVLSLFSGTIPLVVLQLWATKMDKEVVLAFIRVLDQRALRVEDSGDAQTPAVERSYWLSKSSSEIMKLADLVLEFINRESEVRHELNFKQRYVGLRREGSTWGDNFMLFKPRKARLEVHANVEEDQAWVDKLMEAGIDATILRDGRIKFSIAPGQWNEQQTTVTELVCEAVRFHQS